MSYFIRNYITACFLCVFSMGAHAYDEEYGRLQRGEFSTYGLTYLYPGEISMIAVHGACGAIENLDSQGRSMMIPWAYEEEWDSFLNAAPNMSHANVTGCCAPQEEYVCGSNLLIEGDYEAEGSFGTEYGYGQEGDFVDIRTPYGGLRTYRCREGEWEFYTGSDC